MTHLFCFIICRHNNKFYFEFAFAAFLIVDHPHNLLLWKTFYHFYCYIATKNVFEEDKIVPVIKKLFVYLGKVLDFMDALLCCVASIGRVPWLHQNNWLYVVCGLLYSYVCDFLMIPWKSLKNISCCWQNNSQQNLAKKTEIKSNDAIILCKDTLFKLLYFKLQPSSVRPSDFYPI